MKIIPFRNDNKLKNSRWSFLEGNEMSGWGGGEGGGLTPSVIQCALLSRGQNEELSLLVFKFNRAASSSIKT